MTTTTNPGADNMTTAALNTDPTAAYTSRGASMELAILMVQFARHMRSKDLPILIYCIYRSNAEQAKLYAQGRTAPGQRVTGARPGASAHNRTEGLRPASDAFDACPMIEGRPTWDTQGPALITWQEMGQVAQNLGLQWGRAYKSLGGDWSHFEYSRKVLLANRG